MLAKAALAVLVVAVASAVTAGAAFASGPVVVTANGAVEGVADASGAEWRGIPYAAPPVGALRWRPPAPAAPWTGVRDATGFASPCLQPSDFDDEGNATATRGSEDCLYLNVFAPAGAASAPLPVMVHLHGGSNVFGRGYEEASAFVSRGVIVVTLNYRLGVLGFVGHPALSAEGGGSSGEYGVLDQLAALRWVRDNIAAFGGDPANVTLFGLSAGSFDTVALLASPLASGLITRAAVQGDVYWALTGTFVTIADAEQFGSELVGGSPCAEAADVLACMRALPASLLVQGVGGFDVVPWVGGAVLPESPLELIAANGGLPLIVGFNREEDGVFAWPYLRDPLTKANWVHATNLLVGADLGARARSLYPTSDYDSLRWAYITMETDAVRGCPTRRLANVNALSAPTYRFLYTHVYENDPFFAQFRASHALEELFLWGSFGVLGFPYSPSAAELVLSDQMSDYWANFARTGDPNGPGLPVWPQYDLNSEQTLVLDTPVSVTQGYHVRQCALLDTVTPFSFEAAERGQKRGLFDLVP